MNQTRERLLDSAKGLFAAQGFRSTTIRQIAETTGVNISLVSYHFGGKEGLYTACLEESGISYKQLAVAILERATTQKDFLDKLKTFACTVLKSQSEDPDWHRIIRRELESQSEIFSQVLDVVYKKTFQTIILFFQMAKEDGIIRHEISPQELAIMFHGSLLHQARVDHIRKNWVGQSLKSAEVRENICGQMVEVLFHGSLNKEALYKNSDNIAHRSIVRKN